jgi:hypothetical protein
MKYVSKLYMNHTYAICHECMINFCILKTWDVTILLRYVGIYIYIASTLAVKESTSSTELTFLDDVGVLLVCHWWCGMNTSNTTNIITCEYIYLVISSSNSKIYCLIIRDSITPSVPKCKAPKLSQKSTSFTLTKFVHKTMNIRNIE